MIKLSEQPKYALITGAAGGIGQALVRTFQSAGYQVIAVDQVSCPDNLEASHYLQVDLARTVIDESYAEAVFTEVRECLHTNKLEVLINNAAVQILAKTDELSRNDWQDTLNVNLLAPFFWAQALLPQLEAAQGSVINISSIHARLTKKNFVAYATSKAALSGMTRAMAVDLGPRVRINAIEPAAIETEMLKAGFASKPELYNSLQECHPAQRIGSPAEVARLAVLLADKNIDFVHGACIRIDGGIGNVLMDPIDIS
jgi:NAD(P)-dependent dehydrogenase (short-subunit alcohol dehydrogenase family)